MRALIVLAMVVLAGPAVLVPAGPAWAADPVRVGLLHTLSPAPLYLAMARGYFRGQGLDAEFRYFESAQPIAAAAVSGDIDVGITALTGGFFNLAGRGTLTVIAGGLHEEPGFEGTAILASDKAWQAGLRSPAELAGHSLGITQYGSSFHYIAGQIAAKEGFPLNSLTLRPLQSIGNMLAAVRTGQVDATMAIASMAKPVDAAGEAHIIGWVGDLVPYQITAVFAPRPMVLEHAGVLQRFIRAYQHGVADYRAAFLVPHPDPAARAAAIKDIEGFVFTGDPDAARKITEGTGYYDEDARLDAADVRRQLAWFEAQGLVRGADAAGLIDTQFTGVLPSP